MFKIDVCKVCGVNCFWIEGIDGDLAEKEVCSPECLAQLQSDQQSVQWTCAQCGEHYHKDMAKVTIQKSCVSCGASH